MPNKSSHPHARLWVSSLAILSCVAALLATGTAQARSAAPEARVVVAVVDTGTNPYHEFFHRGGPLYGSTKPSSVTPAVLKELGVDRAHIIRPTRTGNFDRDVAADRKQYSKVKRGELYWFEGTNVLGISFEQTNWLRPNPDANAHGVGTSAAVLEANPNAIVIAVEGINEDAERWAFTHPSVDIVSTSYGPGFIPTFSNLSHGYEGVVGNGKAHFGAAANDPSLSTSDQTSGPWWTISVAGFEEETSGGRQVSSGNLADFVGDFTQDLPYCRACERGISSVAGTSFATPRAAGTFSKILLQLRKATGHSGGIARRANGAPLMVSGKNPLTVWDLRRALEQAAYYPGLGDYTSSNPDPNALPVIDQAPWAETGWGLVSPGYNVVDEALSYLGLGPAPERDKSAEACRFMTANMQSRQAYWNRVATKADSFGTTEDPYRYC